MTTIPQEVDGPLSRIPDEILKLMLITLPYQDILNKCTSNKQFARICRNRNFWADKAKQDFGVSIQTFHLKQGQPAKVYHDYLVVHEVTMFLTEVFEFGMFLSGWSGQGPYPSRFISPFDLSTMLSKYHNIIKTYQNSLTSVKHIIDDIRIVDFMLRDQQYNLLIPNYEVTLPDNNSLIFIHQIYNSIPKILFNKESFDLSSVGKISFILIATPVVNADKYGKIIGNFTLTNLLDFNNRSTYNLKFSRRTIYRV